MENMEMGKIVSYDMKMIIENIVKLHHDIGNELTKLQFRVELLMEEEKNKEVDCPVCGTTLDKNDRCPQQSKH